MKEEEGGEDKVNILLKGKVIIKKNLNGGYKPQKWGVYTESPIKKGSPCHFGKCKLRVYCRHFLLLKNLLWPCFLSQICSEPLGTGGCFLCSKFLTICHSKICVVPPDFTTFVLVKFSFLPQGIK